MRRKSVRDRGVPGGRGDSWRASRKSQTDTYHILYSEVDHATAPLFTNTIKVCAESTSGPTLDAIGAARLRGGHIRAASRICINRKESGLVPTVGLTPQEAEEGQTPQKLRLERGKEANDSQFPLESHFFTTNFMN